MEMEVEYANFLHFYFEARAMHCSNLNAIKIILKINCKIILNI